MIESWKAAGTDQGSVKNRSVVLMMLELYLHVLTYLYGVEFKFRPTF
jgi:hypothetical protein